MTPDFLVDLFGDKDTARTVTRVLVVILLVVIPLIVRMLVHLFIRLVRPLFKRFAGVGLGTEMAQALSSPVQFIVVILSWWVAVRLLTEDFSESFHNTVDRLVEILLILGVFWILFHMVDAAANYARRFASDQRNLMNNTVIRFGNQIGEAIVVILGFVVVMDQLGYDLNGVLAGLGLTGLAVALAAQDTLANLMGYLVILSDVPFRIGDFIEVEGYKGKVEHIGFRTSHIRQNDQSLIVIPNKTFNDAIIKNWSRLRKRWIEVSLRLQYDTSPVQVRLVVNEIRNLLESHPQIVHDGSEFVQFMDFSEDGALVIKIQAYMNIADWEQFQAGKEEVQLQILDILHQSEAQRALPTHVAVNVSTAEYPVLSGMNEDVDESGDDA